jgi:hypothetical protein
MSSRERSAAGVAEGIGIGAAVSTAFRHGSRSAFV